MDSIRRAIFDEHVSEEEWRQALADAERADGRPVFAKLPADIQAAINDAAKNGTGKVWREMAETRRLEGERHRLRRGHGLRRSQPAGHRRGGEGMTIYASLRLYCPGHGYDDAPHPIETWECRDEPGVCWWCGTEPLKPPGPADEGVSG